MSDKAEMNQSSEEQEIIFPDFINLWKELYFKTESAWAEAFKQYVSTDGFINMLAQTMKGQLSLEKVTRENVDKYMAASAIPSKKDIARIAELVLSVEEKVDAIDAQLMDNTFKMADNLLRMADTLEKHQQDVATQENMQEKMDLILVKLDQHQQEMAALHKEMVSLRKKADNLTKAEKSVTKERTSKNKKVQPKEKTE